MIKNGTALFWMFALLVFPGTALAGNWGEAWGTMVWGLPVSVPSVPGFGLIALAIALSVAAAWTLRNRRGAVGLPVLFVLLAVPLVVVAGTVTVPNTFYNTTTADAKEVNENFYAVEEAVNDNDGRITQNAGVASAALGAANAAVLDAAAAQSTADSAHATANAAAAVGIVSANVNSAGVLELTLSDGTVINAGTVSAASDPTVALGAWNSAIWGAFPNGGVWR